MNQIIGQVGHIHTTTRGSTIIQLFRLHDKENIIFRRFFLYVYCVLMANFIVFIYQVRLEFFFFLICVACEI